MKKFYKSCLLAVAALCAQQAMAEDSSGSLTIEVDDVENFTIVSTNVNAPATIEWEDKVATISWGEIDYSTYQIPSISITPKDGYFISSKLVSSQGREFSEGYISNAFCDSFQLAGCNGNKYKYAAADIAASRTGVMTVKCDNPKDIYVMVTWSGNQTQLVALNDKSKTDEGQKILFVPNKESPSYLQTSRELCEVKLNGNTLSYYNGYNLYGVNDGSTLDIKADFDAVPYTVKFEFENEDTEGVVSYVKVDGEDKKGWSAADGFTVNAGHSVSFALNSSEYNVKSIYINDNPEYNYAPTFTVKGDVTVKIDASKLAMTTFTVNVDIPSNVIFKKGSTEIPLVAGDNSVSFSTNDYSFSLGSSPLGNITSVTLDGTTVEPYYSTNYSINTSGIKEGSILKIKTSTIERNDKIIVYFDSPEKAKDNSKGFYGYQFAYNNSSSSLSLENGYNEVYMNTSDNPFNISIYGGSIGSTVGYFLNDEAITTGTSIQPTFVDGDVFKIFIGEVPTLQDVEFELPADLDAEIIVDRINTYSPKSKASLQALPGTEVSIKPAADYTVRKVEFNGHEIAADGEGKYVVTIEKGNNSIAVSGSSSIASINADGAAADNATYNLQGIRVNDGAALPAGIYIRGGKKIVVK